MSKRLAVDTGPNRNQYCTPFVGRVLTGFEGGAFPTRASHTARACLCGYHGFLSQMQVPGEILVSNAHSNPGG